MVTRLRLVPGQSGEHLRAADDLVPRCRDRPGSRRSPSSGSRPVRLNSDDGHSSDDPRDDDGPDAEQHVLDHLSLRSRRPLPTARTRPRRRLKTRWRPSVPLPTSPPTIVPTRRRNKTRTARIVLRTGSRSRSSWTVPPALLELGRSRSAPSPGGGRSSWIGRYSVTLLLRGVDAGRRCRRLRRGHSARPRRRSSSRMCLSKAPTGPKMTLSAASSSKPEADVSSGCRSSPDTRPRRSSIRSNTGHETHPDRSSSCRRRHGAAGDRRDRHQPRRRRREGQTDDRRRGARRMRVREVPVPRHRGRDDPERRDPGQCHREHLGHHGALRAVGGGRASTEGLRREARG